MVFEKPRYGAPCNGCGYCCTKAVCDLGKEILGENAEGPCDLLTYKDGRYWCSLVLAERVLVDGGQAKPLLSDALGIGKGCDSEI